MVLAAVSSRRSQSAACEDATVRLQLRRAHSQDLQWSSIVFSHHAAPLMTDERRSREPYPREHSQAIIRTAISSGAKQVSVSDVGGRKVGGNTYG